MAWLSFIVLDKIVSYDQISWFSVIMLLVCLPSDALLQHLPYYLGFSYLGCQSLSVLLTLDEGFLLTAAPPDLEPGVAPLGPPLLKVNKSLTFCNYR